MLGLLFVAANYLRTYHQPLGASAVSPSPKNNAPKASGDPNKQYATLVRQRNQSHEKEAVAKGASYLPTVGAYPNKGLGIHMPAALDKPSGHKPKQAIPQPNLGQSGVSKNQHRTQASDTASNTKSSAMVREMREILKQENVPSQQVAVYYKERRHKGATTAAAEKTTPSSKTQAPGLAPSHLQPGTILYAVADLRLNSDQPGPAMATVVAGKHKGARFIGGFKRQGDRIVVQFNKYIPASGPPESVKAYAVDTRTSQASVETAVNHHYLARWGGLLASSFAEGFGNAVARSGSTVATTIGAGGANSIIVNPSRTAGNEALQALGRVGERAGQALDRNFNEPPTVKLASGSPVGVLIIKGSK